MTTTSVRQEYMKECMIQNAGKIFTDYDGWCKIDKQPKVDGGCIKSNCIKIIDMWNKIPKLQDNTVLKFIVCNMDEEHTNVKHIMIHNKKTNKLIDTSNGRTKMVDYENHKKHNKYSVEIDIEYHTLNNIMFEGLNNILTKKFGKAYINTLDEIIFQIDLIISQYNIRETYLRQICSNMFQQSMNDVVPCINYKYITSVDFVSNFVTLS